MKVPGVAKTCTRGVRSGPSGSWLACWALCFLAFLRHFFFCLPDFFLHAVRALCAVASPVPRVTRPPKTEPTSRRRALRREGEVDRERRKDSKRSGSIGRVLGKHERTTWVQQHYRRRIAPRLSAPVTRLPPRRSEPLTR